MTPVSSYRQLQIDVSEVRSERLVRAISVAGDNLKSKTIYYIRLSMSVVCNSLRFLYLNGRTRNFVVAIRVISCMLFNIVEMLTIFHDSKR